MSKFQRFQSQNITGHFVSSLYFNSFVLTSKHTTPPGRRNDDSAQLSKFLRLVIRHSID